MVEQNRFSCSAIITIELDESLQRVDVEQLKENSSNQQRTKQKMNNESRNAHVDVEAGAAAPRRVIRRSNEQPIKDAVIIIGWNQKRRNEFEVVTKTYLAGSIMILMAIGLLLEFYLSDGGWNESKEHKVAISSTFLCLLAVSLLFGLYLYSLMRKNCKTRAASSENNPESVS